MPLCSPQARESDGGCERWRREEAKVKAILWEDAVSSVTQFKSKVSRAKLNESLGGKSDPNWNMEMHSSSFM